MVAMAEQVLQEMNKAVASITQETGLADTSKKAESTSRGDQEIASSGPGDSISDYTLQGTADVSMLEAIPDLDVFGHFDPTFNLGAVDAVLEGNLDFGPSSNWFEWQQLRG